MDKFFNKALEKLDVLGPDRTKQLFALMSETLELKDSILDSFSEGIILVGEKKRILYQNKTVPLLLRTNHKRPRQFGLLADEIADADVCAFLMDYLNSRQRKPASKEFAFQAGDEVRIILVQVLRAFTTFRGSKCDLVRISDITERRQEENRLKRSESLAQMTTMAAGVAHEIKNPLGSISLYLQLLRRAYKKKAALSGQEAEKYLGVIGEEIERLNSIVVDFLFAVRPLSANLRKEEINPLIEDLEKLVRPEFEQLGLVLTLKLASGLPPLLLDSSLFRQAALNIIKNSIQALQSKFPPPAAGKGRLEIETKLGNNEVLVVFNDNGCGIPESRLPKIFEPYYTTKDTGTGLGLTALLKIVKEHNGLLNVYSKENEGTAFVVSFPVPKDERMKIEYKGGAYDQADDTDS